MPQSTSMPDKRLALIVPSAVFMSLSIGTLNLGIIFLVKDLYGATPSDVGWLAAMGSLAYIGGCLFFRPLGRLIPAWLSMSLSCLVSAFCIALQLILHSLASAFVLYTLHSLAVALFWPRVMGWLSSGIEGRTLGRANSIFSLSWSSSSVIAPYIAGLLSQQGRSLPLYGVVLTFSLTGFFIIAARKWAPSPTLDPRAQAKPTEDRSTSLRFAAWIGLIVSYAFMSIFLNIFPYFAQEKLAMRESSIGLILLIRAASTTLGFFVFGKITAWQFKPLVLPLALVSIFILEFAFIFIRAPLGFALGLFMAGIVQAGIYAMSMFYGASGAPDRDRRMSIHEALLNVGSALGGIAGGFFYQRVSWSFVFIALGAFTLMSIGAQLLMLRRGTPQTMRGGGS